MVKRCREKNPIQLSRRARLWIAVLLGVPEFVVVGRRFWIWCRTRNNRLLLEWSRFFLAEIWCGDAVLENMMAVRDVGVEGDGLGLIVVSWSVLGLGMVRWCWEV